MSSAVPTLVNPRCVHLHLHLHLNKHTPKERDSSICTYLDINNDIRVTRRRHI
eukprot:COSAG06_NODE_14259_length_1173_cov_2.811918_3_plen_52_part_01